MVGSPGLRMTALALGVLGIWAALMASGAPQFVDLG